MKTHFQRPLKRGFTLVELIVAMAVTTIIITVLVGITSVAIDAWKRSRAEVRAARQGKAMLDSLARDLESMVVRKGNSFEWLYADTPSAMPGAAQSGKIKEASTNALNLIFFTAATDRYKGQIGTSSDLGGDVSCASYQLAFQDPLTTSANSNYGTFALYRKLVDPKDSFNTLLGQTDLKTAFSSYASNVTQEPENFVCENVYQFTVTFFVEVTQTSGSTTTKLTVPVVMSPEPSHAQSFRLLGTGIDTPYVGGGATADQIKAGRLTGVQISLTVLTDFGLEQLRSRSFNSDEARAKFFGQNSFEYSKRVELTSM
jgi:prepilin-type N-terminal cleavage/methylation domain-containing protein